MPVEKKSAAFKKNVPNFILKQQVNLMEEQRAHYRQLNTDLQFLENGLRTLSVRDRLWPLEEMDDHELEEFIINTHRLAWECLAIQLRQNMPEYQFYHNLSLETPGYPKMIEVTRHMIQYCNNDAVEEYRTLTDTESRVTEVLQQIHNALIGHYYFQHPGMDTVYAHEVHFGR